MNDPVNMATWNDPATSRISGFEMLAELALDMRWSWSHASDEVWQAIDPELWDLTHNPWVVLQSASPSRIERNLSDPLIRAKIDDVLRAKRLATQAPGWFQQAYPDSQLNCVAYFSMEFMLSEALPIYSGGLGNVAGDQLKAASDLGVPVVGVGLLYSQGYFRQMIDKEGAQQALYPYNDPGQLPIRPLRAPNGEWLRLRIELPGYPVLVRAWYVQVGRATLYLLDSNDAANFPPLRGITGELYGGGSELRLQQELLFGIGGWRLLNTLGIKPAVSHLNEGHAAFAVLERARAFMQETGESFETALTITRSGNLFTTHTAIAAGFDRFDPALVEQYLSQYAETQLGITTHDLLALGRQNPADTSEFFNMGYLAMRGSGAANAVSRLHGHVSRKIFAPLFPRWPLNEVPIGHVTNGVHTPSWDSAAADALWTRTCGKARWLGTTRSLESQISCVTDAELWNFRNRSRERFIADSRDRLVRLLTSTGSNPGEIAAAKQILDPRALTIGFARRFASYKRPNLLLHDQSRLLRLLMNPDRPVQLVLAGKAHPADQAGRDLIREWIHFIRNTAARRHVVFLSDYDMQLTEQMVQGVDLWLNTPRRPWEASGTSGMKVLVNGGINLSELDGWWAEAYRPDIGWALGDGLEHGDDPNWDAFEAKTLYDLLEREVIPEFYDRNDIGIPEAWVARMRASMSQLTPQYSTNRVVRQYTEQYYLPGAAAYLKRSRGGCVEGKRIVEWQRTLRQQWPALRFTELRTTTNDGRHLFEVRVASAGIAADSVRIEIFAEAIDGGNPERHELARIQNATDPQMEYVYRAAISSNRSPSDYTVRAIPHYDGLALPLEDAHILWQR
jgi:glycogen phosphorylase